MNPDDKLPDTGRDWLAAAASGGIREIRGVVDDDLQCHLEDAEAIGDPISSRELVKAIQRLAAKAGESR